MNIEVRLKRVYDPPAGDDGVRVLVDRVWPRGVRKEQAHVHEWLPELGPSTELRKWFNHDPARWEEFRSRYRVELSAAEQRVRLERLRSLATDRPVTLVYGAKDPVHNQAVVIAEELR
ncbi:MAG: DUF488 domain-containing protein [Chloroflexota bacterium]|nr:DUF488 domain-containing protein [Chloroflexota bacterium]